MSYQCSCPDCDQPQMNKDITYCIKCVTHDCSRDDARCAHG